MSYDAQMWFFKECPEITCGTEYQILNFMAFGLNKHNILWPSFRYMAEFIHVAHPSMIHRGVTGLKEKGLVDWAAPVARRTPTYWLPKFAVGDPAMRPPGVRWELTPRGEWAVHSERTRGVHSGSSGVHSQSAGVHSQFAHKGKNGLEGLRNHEGDTESRGVHSQRTPDFRSGDPGPTRLGDSQDALANLIRMGITQPGGFLATRLGATPPSEANGHAQVSQNQDAPEVASSDP